MWNIYRLEMCFGSGGIRSSVDTERASVLLGACCFKIKISFICHPYKFIRTLRKFRLGALNKIEIDLSILLRQFFHSKYGVTMRHWFLIQDTIFWFTCLPTRVSKIKKRKHLICNMCNTKVFVNFRGILDPFSFSRWVLLFLQRKENYRR